MLFIQNERIDQHPEKLKSFIKEFKLEKEYETFVKNHQKKKPAYFKLSERFKTRDEDNKRDVYPASVGIPAFFSVFHKKDEKDNGGNVEIRYAEHTTPETRDEAMGYSPFNLVFYGDTPITVQPRNIDLWVFLMLHPWRHESPFSTGTMNTFVNFQSAKNAKAIVELEEKITEAKQFIAERKLASMETLREVLKSYNYSNVDEMEADEVQSELYVIVNSGVAPEEKIRILDSFIAKFDGGQDMAMRSEIRSMMDASLFSFDKTKKGFYENKEGNPTDKLICKVQAGKDEVLALSQFFKHGDNKNLYNHYKQELEKAKEPA